MRKLGSIMEVWLADERWSSLQSVNPLFLNVRVQDLTRNSLLSLSLDDRVLSTFTHEPTAVLA